MSDVCAEVKGGGAWKESKEMWRLADQSQLKFKLSLVKSGSLWHVYALPGWL